MRLLDLYCGGGGAAEGYHRAGFDEIVGVDINKQINYPFEFVQGDALEFLLSWGTHFDAIHASPPCQKFTKKPTDWGRKRNHWATFPDLIGPTRDLLEALGLPYVIENVPEAPIRHDLMLCGTMFDLRIRKHRFFESNVPLDPAPKPCGDHKNVYNPWMGKGRSAAKMREAMGIDWLPISGGASRKIGYTGDLFNAIPPAYTEHVGRSLIRYVSRTAGT